MRMFIDDTREPRENFDVIARSARDAISWMEKNGCPSYISFDHDLGDGVDAIGIVNWMIEMDLNNDGSFIPKDFHYDVHSANPIGAANIRNKLDGYLEFRNRRENERV